MAMMKKMMIFCALGALTLLSSCDRSGGDTPVVEDPEINISIGEVLVAAEGGEYEVPFEILRSREGGDVVAVPSSEWITESVCADGVVVFEVSENLQTSERRASVILIYSYGEDRKTEASFEVVQEAAPASDMDWDIVIDASYSDAVYLSDKDGVMDVRMVFTDMEVSADGKVTPPGAMLYVEALMPLDEMGGLYVGEYSMKDPLLNEAGTVYAGQVVDYGGTPVTLGTYVVTVDENSVQNTLLVVDGTMRIQETEGAYWIVCEFVTEDGLRLRSSYSGSLTVRNVPGPFSTLTGDYTLDLSNAVGTAKYFADLYGTGGANWFIEFKPSDGNTGDGLNIDLVCEARDFTDGISAGTYTAAPGDSPVPGEYLRGTMDTYGLYGTVYMGEYSYGYPDAYAPAVSGNLEVVRNQDGTYTLRFSFTDDKGHVWDGRWTGTLEMSNSRP